MTPRLGRASWAGKLGGMAARQQAASQDGTCSLKAHGQTVRFFMRIPVGVSMRCRSACPSCAVVKLWYAAGYGIPRH